MGRGRSGWRAGRARPAAVLALVTALPVLGVLPTAAANSAPHAAAPATMLTALADDCGCTGDFVKPAAPAPAFIAGKPADEKTGLDAKKKYRAEGEGQNLAIYTVDKDGLNQNLVLTIPGPNSYGFSPDSDRLITFYGAATMKLYDLTSAGGQPIWAQEVTGASYGFDAKGAQLIQRSGTPDAGEALIFDVAKHTTVALSSDIVGSGNDIVGLSPHDTSVLVEAADGTSAALYAFPSKTRVWSQPSDTKVSTYAFSPDGTYLTQSTITTEPGSVDQQHLYLSVFDVTAAGAGTRVYQTDFAFGLPPGKKAGAEATAFGPHGGVLQLTYANPDSDSATTFVENLATRKVVYSDNVVPDGSTFSFSPCGDVWAIIAPASSALDNLTLLNTTTGAVVASTQVPAGGTIKLQATAKDFTVTAGSGSAVSLAPNPHGQSCSEPAVATLKSVALKDSTVPSGGSTTGTVTLTAAAAADTAVTLKTSGPGAGVPATVTVPAGTDSATFAVTATTTRSKVTVTITAGLSGVSQAATLTVVPIQVAAVELPADPNPISSDVSFVATVRLNGPAEARHAVTLRSSDPGALTVPDSVTVPAGVSSAQVRLTPTPQWRSDPEHPLTHPTWTVTVTATDSTASASLDVPLVSPVGFNYAWFEGGDNGRARAGGGVDIDVALDRRWNLPVEGGGKLITLSTDRPDLVSLPLGPGGRPGFVITETSDGDLSQATREHYIGIRVRPVAESTTATITASIGGDSIDLTLQIDPPDPDTIFTIAGTGMTDPAEQHLQPAASPIDPLRADLCGCVAEVPSPVKDVAVATDGTVYASYSSPDPNPGYHPTGIPSGIARIDASGLTRYADLTGQLDLADPADSHVRSGQLSLGADGTLYVSTGHSALAIGPGGAVSTVPGSAGIGEIADVAAGPDGLLYLADWTHHRVWRLGADGVPTVYVGTGTDGWAGDGAAASTASIGRVYLDMSPLGVLYLGDIDHHVLRRVDASGVISTIAGTGEPDIADDGSLASTAQVDDPNPTAIAGGGVLFGDDTVVQFLSPDGTIHRIAGAGGRGFTGDGWQADSAHLSQVGGVTADAGGNVYVADAENSRVREVASSSAVLGIPPVTIDGVGPFGEVPVGERGQVQHLTLTNGAAWPVTVIAVSVVDDADGEPVDDFPLSADTCTGAVLVAAQVCTVDVALRPVAGGERHGVLQVQVDPPGADFPHPLADLVGTGLSATPTAPTAPTETTAPTDTTATGTTATGTTATTATDEPTTSPETESSETGSSSTGSTTAGSTTTGPPPSEQRSTTPSSGASPSSGSTPAPASSSVSSSVPNPSTHPADNSSTNRSPSGSTDSTTAVSSDAHDLAVVDAAVVSTGDTQRVTAGGFAPGEEVHGWLHSQPVDLGTVLAGLDGTAYLEFTVPALDAGQHTVELIGQRSGHVATGSFTILTVVAPPEIPAGTLVETGLPVAALSAVALLLLVFGCGLLLPTRRRRQH